MALAWGVMFRVAIGQSFGEAYVRDLLHLMVNLTTLRRNKSDSGIFLLISDVIGWVLSGPLSDTVATYFTKRNLSIREPEHRLPSVIPAALFTVIRGITFSTTTRRV
jgi:hypothetical protein